MPSPIANFFIKTIVHSPLNPILGSSFAVISVRSLKTGKLCSTPINVTARNGEYIVISYRRRTWWRNLRSGKPAELTAGGSTFPVTGKVVEGPNEVMSGLAKYFRQYPGYAKYFNVRLAKNGRPAEADLRSAAATRVIIRLLPAVG